MMDVPHGEAAATIVDLWATDCVPCRTSMPALVAKAQGSRREGVTLVLVGILRDDETVESAREVLASWGVFSRFVVDRGGTIQKKLRVERIPATLVLDRQGVVQWVAPDQATAAEILEASLSVATAQRDGAR